MCRRKLVIVGDSSFAEVACELFDQQGTYDVVAFAVHKVHHRRDRLLDRPVHAIEDLSDLCPPVTHDAFVALTYREMNRARSRICAEIKAKGYSLSRYVSPSAFV